MKTNETSKKLIPDFIGAQDVPNSLGLFAFEARSGGMSYELYFQGKSIAKLGIDIANHVFANIMFYKDCKTTEDFNNLYFNTYFASFTSLKTAPFSPSQKLEAIYNEYLDGEKQSPRFPITFDEYLRNWKYKSSYWKVDICKECGFKNFYLLVQELDAIKERKIKGGLKDFKKNYNPMPTYKEGDLVYQCDGYGEPLRENGKIIIRECIPYIIFNESTKEQRKKYTNPRYVSIEICEANPRRFPHYIPGNVPHNDEYNTGLCSSCHRFGDKCVCGENKVKTNQKVYTIFDGTKFMAYIDKFSPEDKYKMIYNLINCLNELSPIYKEALRELLK